METFKNSMEKANSSTGEQLQECLINFLARYRATPHTVTGQTPSEMLNSRRIRTHLDLLHPSQEQVQRARLRQEVHYNTKTKPRQFEIGDLVWVRNFREGKRWLPGIIKERIGNAMNKVLIEGQDMTWCRHTNQLKSRLASWCIPDSIQTASQPRETNNPSVTNTEQLPRQPVPLRRSSRVPKPRRPWSPSTH